MNSDNCKNLNLIDLLSLTDRINLKRSDMLLYKISVPTTHGKM